jgi:hypothetical protein
MIIEPTEAALSKVPKVPLFTDRFAFISGVLGASDKIDKPYRKKIELRYKFSRLLNTLVSKFFKIVDSLIRFEL